MQLFIKFFLLSFIMFVKPFKFTMSFSKLSNSVYKQTVYKLFVNLHMTFKCLQKFLFVTFKGFVAFANVEVICD